MASIPFSHVSVLLGECIDALDIRDGYTYIDCTTGGGGHSLEIAKRLGENSRLICFDRDENAIAAAKERLKDYLNKITFVNDNFSEIEKIIEEYKFKHLGYPAQIQTHFLQLIFDLFRKTEEKFSNILENIDHIGITSKSSPYAIIKGTAYRIL